MGDFYLLNDNLRPAYVLHFYKACSTHMVSFRIPIKYFIEPQNNLFLLYHNGNF